MELQTKLNKETLESNRHFAARHHWQERMKGVSFDHNFAWCSLDSLKKSESVRQQVEVKASKALVSRISKVAKTNDSRKVLFLSALTILMRNYANLSDVWVLLSSGKATTNPDQLIPFRTDSKLSLTPLAFLQASGKNFTQDLKFANYPLARIFDTKMETLQSQPVVVVDFEGEDIALAVRDFKQRIQFSFATGEELKVSVEFDNGIHNSQLLKQFAGHIFSLLSNLLTQKDDALEAIPVYTLKEEQAYRELLGIKKVACGFDSHIGKAFSAVAKRNEGAIALKADRQEVTYAGLDARSNELAHFLLENHVLGIGDRVGVLLDRTPDMLITILGILKAGGVFVPISPEYPLARKEYLLQDSAPQVVVTDSGYLSSLGSLYTGQLVTIDTQKEEIRTYSSSDVQVAVSPSDLAYMIYTSGSSGKPKGVMIEHRSLLNYVDWALKIYVRNEPAVFPLYTNISFDLTITSVFVPLLSGNKLKLYRGDSQAFLLSEILEEGICNVIKLTPSHLRALQSHGLENVQVKEDLKLIVGGEELGKHLAQTIDEHYAGNIEIYNEYGPTEATIGCMVHRYDPSEQLSTVPIGRPIDNAAVYLLDEQMKPVVPGVRGEMYISGDCLARGYMNQPELTASRFVEDLFVAGERMYKTGDFASWLLDGTMLYHGRKDEQVKVRGYRIELSEVSGALTTHKQIQQSVVIQSGDREKAQLVAYYVSAEEVAVGVLRDHLLRQLPDYMLPAHFVRIDTIPLTTNGKLDKSSLPAPQLVTQAEYAEPRNKEEKLLVEVWSQVLGINEIGIDEDFFALGGDSIKSIQISARVRNAGYQLSLNDIFNFQTIASLAPQLSPIQHISDQSEITGESWPSPIQKWFFNGPVKNKEHFNQSLMLSFSDRVNPEMLRIVFSKLQEHHDALRMVFYQEKGEWKQRNSGTDLAVHIEEFEAGDSPELVQSASQKIQASIELEKGPLMKLGLFQLGEGSRLLIVVHHLVVDDVSWQILQEDIYALCEQYKAAVELQLPQKTDPYLTWPDKLKTYLESDTYEKAVRDWNKVLRGRPKYSLAQDWDKGSNTLASAGQVTFSLTHVETRQLLEEVNKPYRTRIIEVLLAGFTMSTASLLNTKSIWVDLEGHGREDLLEGVNISRTVGWFTTIFPVELKHDSDDLSDVIKLTKEQLRTIPNNGFDYMIMKHLDPEQSVVGSSQVSFNYLGQFDMDMDVRSYQVINEDHGNHISPDETRIYDWEITGAVISGCLEMSIAYGKNQFRKDKIEAVMQVYKENLQRLINHCTSLQEVELTPSDLTYKNLSISQLDGLQQRVAIEDIYPLSPMQEIMLFHSLNNTEGQQFFEQMTLNIRGNVKIQEVEQAMNSLVSRHQILRTIFLHEGYGRSLQVVLKDRPIDFQFLDIRKESEGLGRDHVIEQYKLRDRSKLFDLTKDVLMRLTVLQTEDQYFEFIWSHHHILMDGWCVGIIFNEFRQIYMDLVLGTSTSLFPIPPYSRYIKWLEDKESSESSRYWKTYLQGYENLTGLPQYPDTSPDAFGYDLQHEEFILDESLTSKLQAISRANGVTINTIVQVAWGILLSRYTGSSDVVFGSVVSGRPAEIVGVETMIGLFINAIPVRIVIDEDATVASLLKTTQSNALEAEPYHYQPLSETQSMSGLGRDLLNHIIIFHNYPFGDQTKTESKSTDTITFELEGYKTFERSIYDLTIGVMPGSTIRIDLDFNANVYCHETIKEVRLQLNHIIHQVAESIRVLLKDIEMITDSVPDFSLLHDTLEANAASVLTMPELFELRVSENPDHVALIDAGKSYTYAELNAVSNQFARHLNLTYDIQQDEIIGVSLEKDDWLIISILSVLKCGGAYLLLDPNYPKSRIDHLVEDSKCKLTIDVNYIKDFRNEQAKPSDENLGVDIAPNQLAYLNYTSGSTGRPKGVMIEHYGVARITQDWIESYDLHGYSVRVLQMAGISFDVFTGDLCRSLLSGGTLVLCQKETLLNPAELYRAMLDNQITVVEGVPSILTPLLTYTVQNDLDVSFLKVLIFGSDDLKARVYQDIREKVGTDVRLLNSYGTTETTIDSTYFEGTSMPLSRLKSVPIGKPFRNSEIYILDTRQRIVPPGISGEIFIGGAGIARGYLANPELTASKFIPNPFHKGQRLYRTGDEGRWMSDGNIEFLGRIDEQVKIRGFRIELGEIESQLLTHPEIRESVVVAKEKEGEKYLVAYLVSDVKLESSSVRVFLAEKLPDPMVPSYFMQLSGMPLNANGKLDKKALPIPEIKTEGYEAASNEAEEKLVALWSAILKIEEEEISVNVSFFELGGHSLSAMMLINKMKEVFSVEVTIRELFEYLTISALANELLATKKSKFSRLRKSESKEYYSLSLAQKRVYFMQEMSKASLAFNLPAVQQITGNLDIERLRTAVNHLLERHESLRTHFQTIDGEPFQFIVNELEIGIEYFKPEATEINKIIDDFIRPFDLSEAPLFRVGLIQLSSTNHLLMMDVHHIVTDGASGGILISDFVSFYGGASKTPLDFTYKDYAEWQNSKSYQRKISEQRDFWADEFATELIPLELPSETIQPTPGDDSVLKFRLDGQQTAALKEIAESESATLSMILLAVFKIFLSKITSQDDVVAGLVVAGREQSELEGIVGMFPVALPFRSFPSHEQPFSEFLKTIKSKLVQIIDNQNFPYEDLARELNVNRNSGRNPWFDIMFVYQNFERSRLELNDLSISSYDTYKVTGESTLMFTVVEEDQEVAFMVEYTKLMLSKEAMKRYLDMFKVIVNEVIKDKDQTISDINLVDNKSRIAFLEQQQTSVRLIDRNQCFYELFEAQVQKTPARIAAGEEGESLTYEMLHKRVVKWSGELIDLGMKPGDHVSVVLPRGLAMLTGLLTILRCGGVYVPVDVEFPWERQRQMLSDSSSQIIIAHRKSSSDWDSVRGTVVFVEDLEALQETKEHELTRLSTESAAYMIYTSGTTGKPKGVLVHHLGMINHLIGMIDRLELSSEDVMAQTAGPCFDISIWQFLVCLLVGGRTEIILKESVLDASKLKNSLRKNQVSIFQSVPSLLTAFVDEMAGESDPSFPDLRWLIPTGEALNVSFVRKWYDLYPDISLLNAYGPAEASDDVTVYEVPYPVTGQVSIPIGTPLQNLHIYILDSSNELCPAGVRGEICVSGIGVGLGYWGDEEKTARSFVANPFWEELDQDADYRLMYKTGDMGYYQPDGDVVYSGRQDDQVKVRGARIELGEIQTKLSQHALIREAVVLVRSIGGTDYLVGYYVSEEEFSYSDLEGYLSIHLPNYMIPSYFMALESLPVTANGKLDKQGLPDPEIQEDDSYVAPSNDTEEQLVSLWAEVLGVEQEVLSVTANFFSLGGHSLHAMTITNRIYREFGKKVSLIDFFSQSTIQDMATHLTEEVAVDISQTGEKVEIII